ncbi:hypothetical protein [Alcaligenes sp. Marseille-Q7550]
MAHERSANSTFCIYDTGDGLLKQGGVGSVGASRVSHLLAFDQNKARGCDDALVKAQQAGKRLQFLMSHS